MKSLTFYRSFHDQNKVELPGPILLGEGKPNNQNHAIIFTRGEAVQAIDMNQDGGTCLRLFVSMFARTVRLLPAAVQRIKYAHCTMWAATRWEET